MKKKIYIGGHCLTRGSQLQRMEEKDLCLKYGHEVFNPMDAEHNDKKACQSDDLLCDKIVENDKIAFKWADTVIIEPLPEALGTHVELGTLHGMRETSIDILAIMNEGVKAGRTMGEVLYDIRVLCETNINRRVIPHYEDIRRVEGITETGDYRSLGINQYVVGVCRDLTGDKPFYSMEEIEQILSK